MDVYNFLDQNSRIVIDNGSGVLKAGFSGEDAPQVVIPAMVGRPRHHATMAPTGLTKEVYVGNEAQEKRGVLDINYPIADGIIHSWEDMELLWSYVFYHELGVNPEDAPVLVTEAAMNPKKNREHMAALMFEAFDVPALFVSIQAVLALYSMGRTTGVMFDAGDGVTHIVPIWEGYPNPYGVQRVNLAGRHLTEFMRKLLMIRGHGFVTPAEREIVRNIKERLCYVSLDYDHDIKVYPEQVEEYTLPDGQMIDVGHERFKCPEALFEPMLVGKEDDPVQQLVVNSIEKCDIDIRKTLYRNIVLSGGTTMLTNFAERLKYEIQDITGPGASVQVHDPLERKYSVWIGGSILSSLPTFSGMWVTRDEYEETGPRIINTKCF
eukprot:gb/GECH01013982.1/.p1 GENE.gb/GECH01013982.1/~~gb/GECH01013982.1/.p1  ORF type:complete len:379 (+),score=51.10 gb/GECH01013982.1/:1-1137(+)